MERLNTRVAEGYPSRSQESAGLKVDQFVRTPKSQAKWYQQYCIRQDTNIRPGKTIFSWPDSEARLNSQFYCVNTSYPMDNCFTGRRDRSRQTPEKDVLYIIPAGPVRRVHSPGGASYFLFLSRQRDVIASFSFGTWRVKTCFQRQGNFGFIPSSSVLFHI